MFSFLFAVMHRAGLEVHNIVLLKVLNPLKLRNDVSIANKIIGTRAHVMLETGNELDGTG